MGQFVPVPSAGSVASPRIAPSPSPSSSDPLTPPALQVLRVAQAERAGIGEARVLPAPKDPSEPVSRHLLRDWWYQSEELADLEHIDRLGWHGLLGNSPTNSGRSPSRISWISVAGRRNRPSSSGTRARI